MPGRDAARTLPGASICPKPTPSGPHWEHQANSGCHRHCPAALLNLQRTGLSRPPCPAPLILFVGILVQAKPCGQEQMLQRPSLPPQLQATRVKEVGVTHNAWPDRLPRSPAPAPSLALPRTWGLQLNQTMALAGLDWQVGMRWPVTGSALALSFIHSFSKYSSSPCRGPGSVLGTGGVSAVSTTDRPLSRS